MFTYLLFFRVSSQLDHYIQCFYIYLLIVLLSEQLARPPGQSAGTLGSILQEKCCSSEQLLARPLHTKLLYLLIYCSSEQLLARPLHTKLLCFTYLLFFRVSSQLDLYIKRFYIYLFAVLLSSYQLDRYIQSFYTLLICCSSE